MSILIFPREEEVCWAVLFALGVLSEAYTRLTGTTPTNAPSAPSAPDAGDAAARTATLKKIDTILAEAGSADRKTIPANKMALLL